MTEPRLPRVRVASPPKLLPHVRARLYAFVVGPEVSTQALIGEIASDPALVCHFLKFAHTLGRGPQEGYGSIAHAIAWIGHVPVRAFLRQLCERSAYEDPDGFVREISQHCIEVGTVARLLAEDRRDPESETIHLFGLLHDIGILLCLQDSQFDYRQINLRSLDHRRLHLEERKRFGFDHAKIGWHALNVWRLPEPLPSLVAWHHQANRAYAVGGSHAKAVAYVRAAEELVPMLKAPRDLVELRPLVRWEAMRQLEFKLDGLVKLWPALVSCLGGSTLSRRYG